MLLISCLTYGDHLSLRVGESRVIPAPVGQTVRLKNSRVLSAVDSPHGIRIQGKLPGTAKVFVGAKEYEVKVQAASERLFALEVEKLLRRFRGLSVKNINGVAHVRGHLHRVSDWQAISELARQFNSKFVFAALPDVEIIDDAKNYVHWAMAAENLPKLPLDFTPVATVHAPEDLKKVERQLTATLDPLGIQVRYDKAQIAVAPLVRVKIVVAEINKSFQRELGFDWSEEISAKVAPQLDKNLNIETTLRLMEEKGEGQILASPSLLARSGSSADFLAGGEFGIKLVSGKIREVVWKRHGIYLKIRPVADYSGSLSIELSTEVSLIDASQTIEGIPALKTNRMSTHFDLSAPRTIILSGLIRNDWGESRSQVPMLGDIPILGALFRSDNFHRKKSELVIFVTPELVSQQSREQPKLPKGWQNDDE